MSIKDNKEEFEKACLQGERKYPHWNYQFQPDSCNHNFSFVIYCDGGDWDIVRCTKCGEQIVTKCNFDDEYD